MTAPRQRRSRAVPGASPRPSVITSPTLPNVRPSTKNDPVGAYAYDVVMGKIVACRYVRLACERHFRDLKEGHKRGLVFRHDFALRKRRWEINDTSRNPER